MDEQALRGLIADVKAGKLSRRGFVQPNDRGRADGADGDPAARLFRRGAWRSRSRPPTSRPSAAAAARSRCCGGRAPTLLNPHFAVGTKDQDGSRIFYEPLAGWDRRRQPACRSSPPRSRAARTAALAADGKSVTWKLKQGVKWHDGKPFTADDVRLQLGIRRAIRRPPRSPSAAYKDVKVEKVDQPHGPRACSSKPTPFWADAFVGARGMIIPKHLFADYTGAKSREAPTNLKPVGTGPYKFDDFKPGDMVRGEINPNYHMPNRPHFDAIEMKGGGDAVSAARAVLQTGEYDFAWNMQVEDEILAAAGEGRQGHASTSSPGGNIEHIQLNTTDPWTEVDGERVEPQDQAPDADRSGGAPGAGPAGRQATRSRSTSTAAPASRPRNFINNPQRFRSKNTKYEFNVDKANDILDEGRLEEGRRRHPREGRQEAEVRLPDLDQPAAPEEPGDRQAGLPEGRHRDRAQVGDGVGVLLVRRRQPRHLPALLLRPADVQRRHDAARSRRSSCASSARGRSATKENKWQGRNITRWQNKEYDDAYKAAQVELDPVKRAAHVHQDERPGVNDHVVIPVVAPARRRRREATSSARELSGWDNNFWNLQDWYKEA